MQIVGFESLTCHFGWRPISFLKLSTDSGIVGWSEFGGNPGAPGLVATVDACAEYVLGKDPLKISAITSPLTAMMRPARGGVNRQAVAAIENALLDVKGKAYGLPVSALLGGAVRDRIPVYWSHCGTYRTGVRAGMIGVDALESYDDVAAFGREVKRRGFLGLKTNILGLENQRVAKRESSFSRGPAAGRYWDSLMIDEACKVVAAFRSGVGDAVDVSLDINFNFHPEGVLRVEKALRPWNLAWLEMDMHDPVSLGFVRQRSETPIGSGETLYECQGYRPYLEGQSLDVAIVDVLWNGFIESVKIAALAEAYQTPVMPHNYYGNLASLISAHWSAIVPNLHVMEIDVDGVPWRDEIASPPIIEGGCLVLPDSPGWGVEIDEEAIRKRSHGFAVSPP